MIIIAPADDDDDLQIMMMTIAMTIAMTFAGLPEPPDDCRVTNETNESLSVTCR